MTIALDTNFTCPSYFPVVNMQSKQIKCKGTTGSCVIIGSSVATGMNRYITFISVHQNSIAKNVGSKIWFCSTTTSQGASTTALASATKKFTVRLTSAILNNNKFFQYPKAGPNSYNPLFSVATSKFLVARSSKAQNGSASCTIFIQYYDK